MNVLFLGATKGMGRALARLMAARGDRIFLVGRDEEELEKTAADLFARSGEEKEVRYAPCDLKNLESFAPAFDKAEEALGRIETVVVTAGLFDDQNNLEENDARRDELLTVNFTRTIGFCEEARRRLLESGGGNLCVFSSVAGERGRKPVAIYGASKAGLTHYLESLDHKFKERGLNTICVKPGFVKTGMTAGLKPPPFAGEPEAVAKRVLGAIDKGKPVVYVPAIWGLIMFVIRCLPRFVMRRIEF